MNYTHLKNERPQVRNETECGLKIKKAMDVAMDIEQWNDKINANANLCPKCVEQDKNH